MLKKTIKYKDFNDNEVEEDYFFHLSQAELVELEMSHQGGLSEALQKIITAEDGKAIIAEFKNIILNSYGKRSEDGKRFVKNQQLREEFESSEAYSTLFMELVTETDKAVEFVNGIIPGNMAEQVEKLKLTSADLTVVPDAPKPDPIILTKADLIRMSAKEISGLGPRIESGEVKLAEEDPTT